MDRQVEADRDEGIGYWTTRGLPTRGLDKSQSRRCRQKNIQSTIWQSASCPVTKEYVPASGVTRIHKNTAFSVDRSTDGLNFICTGTI